MIDRHNPSMTFNMLELGRIATSPDEVGENKNKAKPQPYYRLSYGLAELGKNYEIRKKRLLSQIKMLQFRTYSFDHYRLPLKC